MKSGVLLSAALYSGEKKEKETKAEYLKEHLKILVLKKEKKKTLIKGVVFFQCSWFLKNFICIFASNISLCAKLYVLPP